MVAQALSMRKEPDAWCFGDLPDSNICEGSKDSSLLGQKEGTKWNNLVPFEEKF
jgi:hypothetical protein